MSGVLVLSKTPFPDAVTLSACAETSHCCWTRAGLRRGAAAHPPSMIGPAPVEQQTQILGKCCHCKLRE